MTAVASSEPRTGGCPDDDALAQWVAGDLPRHERDRLHEHLDGCATCRDLLAALGHAFFDVEPEPPRADPAARYSIVARLGSGGMGVVYRAHDRRLGREVALKLLLRSERELHDDDHGARLRAEARAMAAIDHPNVVRVFDVGTWNHRPFVAMELVEGTTLRGWLQAEPRTVPAILEMFRAAARGLAAAHRVGLVHRDFKPDNVLVGAGRVCVADFGMVAAGRGNRAPASGTVLGPLTRTGAMLGTPVYMAPEQLDGDPVDARADQFAFCVALFEALFGERPFSGTTPAALRAAQQEGPRWPDSPAVPAAIRGALARGLAERPGDRFPDIERLLHAITKPPRARPHTAIVASAGIGIVAALIVAAPAGAPDAVEPASSVATTLPRALEDELHAIEALRDRGELPRALARVNVVIADAGLRDDRWTLAMALFLRASIQDSVGDTAAAEVGYRDAFFLAQTENDPATAFDAAIACARLVGEVQARFEDGLAWLAHGRAMLARRPDPAREAALLEAEGQIRLTHGDATAAAELHRAALALREGAEPRDEGMIGASLHNLALAESRLGRNDSAAELLGRALVTTVRDHGMTHPFALTNLMNLATIEELRGRPFAAEHWHRTTIALLENASASNPPLLASARYNLASLLVQVGDPRDAEQQLEAALALWRASYGDSHPDVALALLGLGNLALVRHEPELARTRCEQARVIQEERLPAEHSEAVAAIGCLARAARHGDRPDEAKEYYERLLAVAGADDFELQCEAQTGLGLLARETDELERAQELLQEAMATCEKMPGPPSRTTLVAWENLGLVARDAGDVARAREHYAEARRIAVDAFGADSVRVAVVDLALARVDLVAGDYDLATTRLRAALDPLRTGERVAEAQTAATLLAHVVRTCGSAPGVVRAEGEDVDDARAWLTSLRTDRRAIARACRRATRGPRAPGPSSSTAG